MRIIDQISEDLSVPASLLEDALNNARRLVKIISIPKRNGSTRKVLQPARKLKLIQYWLTYTIFTQLPTHNCATAFAKGSSIKKNARRHSSNRYFLKIDLKDFFWSIKFQDLEPIINKFHQQNKPTWSLDATNLDAIRHSCFYKKDTLPIGYSSSPFISNAVMFDFDSKVVSQMEENQQALGDVIYTRYADDMVFSTNKKYACKAIYSILQELIDNCTSPDIKINDSKTSFTSSSGGSAVVTGIKICHDGHLTVSRKYKDRVRLLLSLYRKSKLSDSELSALTGHLNYLRDADPAFFTRLSQKFFQELNSLINIS